MSAEIIQFPKEVRENVAMARIVQRACARLSWTVDLSEAITIYKESKRGDHDPALEAIAREVASELGIALYTEDPAHGRD